MIFKGLSMKPTTQFFLEGESPTLRDTYRYTLKVILLVRLVKYWFSFSALVKFNQYLTNP